MSCVDVDVSVVEDEKKGAEPRFAKLWRTLNPRPSQNREPIGKNETNGCWGVLVCTDPSPATFAGFCFSFLPISLPITMTGSKASSSQQRRQRSLGLLLTSLCALACATSPPTEDLYESLLLKPLPDGRVLSTFEFTLSSSSSSDSSFRLLPRALLQPIQRFNVSSVDLALHSGRWEYASWGSPDTVLPNRTSYLDTKEGRIRVGEESVGSGAELLVTFEAKDEGGERWKGLTSALAGLFCTTLDGLDERHTVQPQLAYQQHGKTYHALLPGENVCTENLTPYLKLLPCKSAAGLASLLNPLALFSAPFHGLSVHVEKSQSAGWEVKFTFTAVFAPAVTRDVSIRDWSIRSLFGRTINQACPLAKESTLRVLKPPEPEGVTKYVVNPLPPPPECRVGKGGKGKKWYPVLGEEDEVTDELASSDLLVWETEEQETKYNERLQERWRHYLDQDGEFIYDLSAAFSPSVEECRTVLSQGEGLDVGMTWPHETRFAYPPRNAESNNNAVAVERTLLGAGQERTTLQVSLTNTDARVAQRVVWYETLGYFVKPYLHTLSHSVTFLPFSSNSTSQTEDELLRSIQDYASPVESIYYQPVITPGKRGGRKPFVLESVVRIPAQSRVVLTIEVRKVFVAYSQHPPDAHRGFDLAPAIIFPLAPEDPRKALTKRPRKSKALVAPTTLLDRILSIITPTQPEQTTPTNIEISKTKTRIYTLPRLVELATPDFSFVYTNIIFTSTVIALFFGSTLNTLLRTFTDYVL